MQRKPTIYIVDGEREVLDAITQLVKPIGPEVKTFTRADDFLSYFHDDGPGCLVLAVRIPDMSGVEIQARLVQAGCQIPVIFITGHADVRMAVAAMKTGAVDFLEKPFRSQELFDEIQQSLRSSIEKWQQRDEEQRIECELALLKSGEREVIDLINEGKTNEQIARELQISVRGVEARRAKAKRTLRVDSKSDLLKLLRGCTPQKSPK